jgi:hypothetical protein
MLEPQPFISKKQPKLEPQHHIDEDLAHLALSCLILPHLASSCLILPHPASSFLILPHLASSCFILPHLASSCLILPYLASSCLILPHLASSCLILLHLVYGLLSKLERSAQIGLDHPKAIPYLDASSASEGPNRKTDVFLSHLRDEGGGH